MNYRTMVKGALALSLSLIVGSSWAGDSQQYGATFEQTPVGTVENDFAYTEGDGITNAKYRVTQDVEKPYGWFSGSEEGDESKIVARTDAAGGHALQLNTDANTLTNKLAQSVADKLNDVLAGENGETQGSVYFETEVKFVASDTDDAGIKGGKDATKFAIYAYCKDDVPEGQQATTNLVVYHAYQDYNDESLEPNGYIGYTNEVFATLINTEVYTKLRVEMKKVHDDGADKDRMAFSVTVGNGDPLSSTTAFSENIWFLTVEDPEDTDAAEVASLNFKGTGAIDNIKAGVIEEAQPPDDTWKLTGFAPDPGNILPDSATSTDTMLVYSNFTGNYVAKDTSIGRTIDAFWIGAKIIAPEAVTSETIGSWKFDMAGNPGLSFNTCKDGQDGETGLYYMYAWVPVTAAKVRDAIAEPKNDIVYTFDFYNENDLTVTQRLSMVVSPADVVLTNTDDIPGVETIEVINWEENVPAPATVITVACVGGVTYTEANGVYTFTPNEGYAISSIYTNGADTATASTGILDLSASEGTINVVAAAKKIRTAIGHKWYENPGVKATTVVGKGGDAGPYRFSVGSDFAAISYGNYNALGTGFKLFAVDDLLNGNATPIYGEAISNSLEIAQVRGAAISEALDVALITAYNGGKAYSLPLSTSTPAVGVDVFEITNDRGITFDRAYFSADNQYLYTTEVAGGTNTKIAKWAIADGLKGSGQKLTLVTEYTMPARVRDFAYAVINNKELFYVLQNNKAGVCVYDVATGTTTQLTDTLVNGGNYGSVAVSMTSTSTPTLTFFPSMTDTNTDPMKVYKLAADGLSIVETLATFTAADLAAAGATAGSFIRSAWPSEDDETLYLGYGNSNLYVLQYVEPQYTAVYTGSENVIVTNTYDGSSYEWDEAEAGTQVACLSGTVLSFYPTEGNVITNVTIGGVAQTGFDPACYSITVVSDTNLVVLAGASAADDYTAGDTVGAETLNADMAAWLNTKKGTATKAEFEKTLDEDSLTLAEEYLLNTDPTVDTTVEFKISSIAVGDTVDLQVTLTRTEGNEAVTAAINGELQIVGATSLDGTFGNGEAVNATFEGATTAAKSLTTQAKFFKAVIVQKSAQAGN